MSSMDMLHSKLCSLNTSCRECKVFQTWTVSLCLLRFLYLQMSQDVPHWCIYVWQVLKPLVRSKLHGLASALLHAATAAHSGSGSEDSEDDELLLDAAQEAARAHIGTLWAFEPTDAAQDGEHGSKPRSKRGPRRESLRPTCSVQSKYVSYRVALAPVACP